MLATVHDKVIQLTNFDLCLLATSCDSYIANDQRKCEMCYHYKFKTGQRSTSIHHVNLYK